MNFVCWGINLVGCLARVLFVENGNALSWQICLAASFEMANGTQILPMGMRIHSSVLTRLQLKSPCEISSAKAVSRVLVIQTLSLSESRKL